MKPTYEELEKTVLALISALTRLRDCDWVITPANRMDAVREIAREALASTASLGNEIVERIEREAAATLMPLARFGLACLDESGETLSEIDDIWLQEEAIATGCIEQRTVAEPCGEHCTCADTCEFPHKCYFDTAAVKRARAILGTQQVGPVPVHPPAFDGGTTVSHAVPSGTVEVWQDGKRVARIENIGTKQEEKP